MRTKPVYTKATVRKTGKNLIEYTTSYKTPPASEFGMIHASGEKDSKTGEKGDRSEITMLIKDYSEGKGEKAKDLFFTVSPADIRLQMEYARMGLWGVIDIEPIVSTKIFGTPDKDGYCEARMLKIEFEEYRSGKKANNPWKISIANGKGIKVDTKEGGCTIKAGSFKTLKTATIYMSKQEYFKKMSEVMVSQETWENTIGSMAYQTYYTKEFNKANGKV